METSWSQADSSTAIKIWFKQFYMFMQQIRQENLLENVLSKFQI